jgi:thioredoxin reductase (NADPH)
VVGGGDTALDEGMYVARYASKVTVFHRRDTLRASAILQERAFANPKLEFVWNTIVTAIDGDGAVTSITVRDLVNGEERDIPMEGVFIFIGQTPNTEFIEGLVDMDEGGHVVVNEWMETSLPGIFAAGDVRSNSARQVVSAAGDGATAVIRADHYLSDTFG